MAILIFYGLSFLVALAIAAAAYRLTRRYGRSLAIVVALLVASVETLLFPIPIHGGFTFLLEVAIDELKIRRRSFEERRDRAADRAFLADLEARFADALSFEVLERRPSGWTRVIDDTGAEGWLEPESGLVWRGPLASGSAGLFHSSFEPFFLRRRSSRASACREGVRMPDAFARRFKNSW